MYLNTLRQIRQIQQEANIDDIILILSSFDERILIEKKIIKILYLFNFK